MLDGADQPKHAGGRLAVDGLGLVEVARVGGSSGATVRGVVAEDGAHAVGRRRDAGISWRVARAVQAGWRRQSGHGAQRRDAGSAFRPAAARRGALTGAAGTSACGAIGTAL